MEAPDTIPECARLRAVIAHCEKRVGRACHKARVAASEQFEAELSLETAQLRLAEWLEANPDPQGSLLEGLTNV